jgi:hypothetical protein
MTKAASRVITKNRRASAACKLSTRKHAPSILDALPPLTRTLISRVSDMRNGLFRPELVLGDDGLGEIYFGTPVASIEEARRLAVEACKRGVRAAAEALAGAPKQIVGV